MNAQQHPRQYRLRIRPASLAASVVTQPLWRMGLIAIAGVAASMFIPYRAWSQQIVTDDVATAERVVARLRDLPTPLPTSGNGIHAVGELLPIPQSEVMRDASYRELHHLGSTGVAALARAYDDSDVRMRRNVALALNVLGEGIWRGLPKLDVSSALPELMTALSDEDADVRAWSAQAVGTIGPDAQPAVPALIRLLGDRDEGSRNSACIGLTGIGPAARSACTSCSSSCVE